MLKVRYFVTFFVALRIEEPILPAKGQILQKDFVMWRAGGRGKAEWFFCPFDKFPKAISFER